MPARKIVEKKAHLYWVYSFRSASNINMPAYIKLYQKGY